jgi:hypothetical protein
MITAGKKVISSIRYQGVLLIRYRIRSFVSDLVGKNVAAFPCPRALPY